MMLAAMGRVGRVVDLGPLFGVGWHALLHAALAVPPPRPDEEVRAWGRRSGRGDAGGAERLRCRTDGKSETEARRLIGPLVMRARLTLVEGAHRGSNRASQLSGSCPNSRSSCEQRQAVASLAAHSMAASRDGSSKTQKPPLNSFVCG